MIVAWSPAAVASDNVKAEARRARQQGRLLQVFVEACEPPLFFGERQGVDLAGWTGDMNAPGWRKVAASVAELTGGPGGAAAQAPHPVTPARKHSICVLPFANMSGDPEQEYFSDGISEDIITDLAKVSALSVVARNTAFTFKGKAVDVRQVARQLGVAHVLEGSVRKAGGRIRITAQLIDGAAGDHVWAERYDRVLDDIFALQDEISEAIVGALKLKLLPEEKKAIEQRGTNHPDAYNLYLMARQHYVVGNQGDRRREEAIIELCRRATEIDPDYARAWGLMSLALAWLHTSHGAPADDSLAAAERALMIDPDLADAHAVRAKYLAGMGRHEEAFAEIESALGLDPESFEVNETAALLHYQQRQFEDSIRYFEKATVLMEADYGSPGMLMSCYAAVGNEEQARRAARLCLGRAEKALEKDQSSGGAMGFGVPALAILGEPDRARDWMARALRIDPDNLHMRYNFACTLSNELHDSDGALDLLGPFFARTTESFLNLAKVDPDFDNVRANPRFQAMIAAAEARLGEAGPPPAA